MKKRLIFMNKKTMIGFIIVCSSLLNSAWAGQSQDVLLQYKFRKGDQFQYKTERHDSTEAGMGNQTMVRTATIWSLETLSVIDTPTDQTYALTIKNDTTWTDQQEPAQGGAGPGQGRRMMIRPDGGRREQNLEIAKTGKPVSKDASFSPFLLPLPDHPVSVNASWNFELTSEQKGRRRGTTTVKGQCLLYDLQKEAGQTLALIIVNAESTGQGKFQMKRQEMNVSGTFASSGKITSLVYFDVDKGRIVEVVSDETRESMTESSAFSSKITSKSKTTIKLMTS